MIKNVYSSVTTQTSSCLAIMEPRTSIVSYNFLVVDYCYSNNRWQMFGLMPMPWSRSQSLRLLSR